MKLSKLLMLAMVLIGLSVNAKQPNILFLCMDDLKPELGCYGEEQIQTPNIDKLAAGGMLFEHHYVQQAVCACSRVSMFTGLRPDTTRIWDLKHDARTENPSVFTMQEYFKQHGYTTVGAGKVFHGFKNEDPQSWSVPFKHDDELTYNSKFPKPADNQYQAKAIHEAFAELEELGIKGYKPRKDWLSAQDARPPIEHADVPDDAYSDGAIANYGIEQLNNFSKSGNPFFLTLGFHKPHLPFVAPQRYWDLYPDDSIQLAEFREHAKGSPDYAYHTWGELRNYSGMPKKGDLSDNQQRDLIHGYFACVSYVDAQVGRVLDALKQTGLDQNTIVILWGDHGWHLGDHDLWCKHSNFEQATHSPLIVSAPGFPTAGKTEAMVESLDIFPTLCELAKLPVPGELQGTSLRPILIDPAASVKAFSMSQYPRGKLMGYAMRTERYRMVTWIKGDIQHHGKFDPANIASIELYNYQTDPLETINLAKSPEHKGTVEALQKKLAGYFMTSKK